MPTYDQRVAAGYDDGHLSRTVGVWNRDHEYGRIGNEGIYGDDVLAAFRFSNVNIPKGAAIDSAYIYFIAFEDRTEGTIRVKIIGIDEDNTANFASDPTGRPQTSAKVDWDFSTFWYTNNEYGSVDIKSVIQEIINREGWSPGNHLGIFVFDDGGDYGKVRTPFHYEGSAIKAPRLVINYTVAPPIPDVKVVVDGVEKYTDANGRASFTVSEGEHTWSIQKVGYSPEGGTVNVIGDTAEDVPLSKSTAWGVRVTVNVKDAGGTRRARAGEAEVKINDIGELPLDYYVYHETSWVKTDSNGQASFASADYPWLEGYDGFLGANRLHVVARLVGVTPEASGVKTLFLSKDGWSDPIALCITCNRAGSY